MSAFISSRRRIGFTLVEVLVVTGILAILFALATGVAIKALASAQDARVTSEMRQLESAIAAFKQKYGVSHLPSRFRLRALAGTAQTQTGYFQAAFSTDNDQIEKNSRDLLFTMFPRLDGTKPLAWFPSTAPFSWNAASVIDLNGPECLAFFLGGWNGLDGFSNNPKDPTTASNPVLLPNPIPPRPLRGEVSFEFDSKRLKSGVFVRRTRGGGGVSQGSGQASPAFVYLDAYSSGLPDDQPYYYFSTKNGNDYNPLDAIVMGSAAYPSPAPGTNFTNPLFRISAHVDPTGRFFNPKGFQMFSAGRDKSLATIPPTMVTPAGMPAEFSAYNNGQFLMPTTNQTDLMSVDNLCNFHPVKMGISQ